MKVKLIIISIVLLLVMVFASGCIPIMEKLGLVNPVNEEQLSPEKGGPPDGLVKVLIGFKEKPGKAQQAMVKGVGGQIKYTYNLIPAIAASVPEVAIEALKKNPNITDVELDSMVYALDTELESSWGVERIGAGDVHDSGNKGTGIKVAIIDSGIDYLHEDLKANYIEGWDFVNNDSDPMDDDGHGTHVAGTVAAEDDSGGVIGVAPEASLYALKVLNKEGVGYVSDVILAVQWATENEIQVINMSLGGRKNIFLEWACDSAYSNDLLLVAAAGNGGAVIYPAAYSSVIAVSATDSNDDLAYFSSTGKQVELAAPGVDINSTLLGGGYGEKSGTSMASPHVAGTAALVWKANPSWSNDKVRAKLQETAEDIGLSTREQGYGLVDADEAAGVPSTPTNTPPTVSITSPADGSTFDSGALILFEGTASDTEDGNLTADDLVWTSSIIDGPIGIGGSFSTILSDGTHIITANVTDSGNKTGSDSIGITVGTPSNIMHVSDITFTAKKAGKNLFLYTTVEVLLGDNSAVDGARVTMALTDGTSSWNFSSDTGLDGTVKFTLKAQPGNYTATVTEVLHPDPDYVWDGITMFKDCTLYKDGTVNQ